MSIEKLFTKDGRELDKTNILTEYPRPQLYRNSYLNLNGEWDCLIKNSNNGKICYQGKILVPFSPESLLSGVNHVLMPYEALYYRRTFTLPEGFDRGRVILNFGAVDYSCKVKINDFSIFEHKNGYLPFSFDISPVLKKGENILEVEVVDPSDMGIQARGKQKIGGGGIWYTPISGIWQTVWIESLPPQSIDKIRLTPIYDEGKVQLNFVATGGTELDYTLYEGNNQVSGDYYNQDLGKVICTGKIKNTEQISIKDFVSWSPENPHLYFLKLQLGEDEILTYFGMRKFSTGVDKKGFKRLMLNNKPYFHKGVLDQGYWADGLYTACTDNLLAGDIKVMKAMGFNMLRKHIKIEPLRWYYHCDRLGMLVWQDMVSGGDKAYALRAVAGYPALQVAFTTKKIGLLSDGEKNYSLFRRASEEGRQGYYDDLVSTIFDLINVVSLALWVPFNEGWGQFDALKAEEFIRSIDPTRLIDHASGWHDQGGGDLNSFHIYWTDFVFPKLNAKDNRVVALTEFGGYGQIVKGHTWDEKNTFGYYVYKNTEKLTEKYKELFEKNIIPQVNKVGLSAIVYTQVSDVEMEINGLLTYDREVVKIPVEIVKSLNDKLVIEE